jgi:hypothetical protein
VGTNPVDRGKPGSKLHLVCDGSGLPATAAVTAANVADVTMLAGGAVAVVAELLQAAAAAVGPRFGAVVRVRPAGLRGRLLQPAPPASG